MRLWRGGTQQFPAENLPGSEATASLECLLLSTLSCLQNQCLGAQHTRALKRRGGEAEQGYLPAVPN